MTCLYLHFCLLDLLNLSILSLVSAITLISPVITRMLGSNGELSNRQQCFPNRIISFRKVLDGRLPGSSPSRIQGYPQDDELGERIAKQRAGLDLP